MCPGMLAHIHMFGSYRWLIAVLTFALSAVKYKHCSVAEGTAANWSILLMLFFHCLIRNIKFCTKCSFSYPNNLEKQQQNHLSWHFDKNICYNENPWREDISTEILTFAESSISCAMPHSKTVQDNTSRDKEEAVEVTVGLNAVAKGKPANVIKIANRTGKKLYSWLDVKRIYDPWFVEDWKASYLQKKVKELTLLQNG